ncbi:bifunctional 5,10-methylenetetrahydrofolate dehydrogenase/5,10-methenyltetrahydrofolate cyclohydrolase [Anaerovorax odorimutans]|uniref:bifunctional 5,10-methylenetetrahydrofolate dehydrogenase/5,10-methenyltetrahydrofolate cyclohydrolase n=1 Tax=Anaerovorax odorimutans TaxID=109327 RepID=UPI00042981FC|nr:bifunctional 5,10-methylenetetrahydrofolate dehydrogenase/5,10-methenyltetrahydrofolate cyclohydrolase [Anaerovorax odorimutans]
MILKGKPVADEIKGNIIKKVNEYRQDGIQPKLAILRVGERPDDIAYESRLIKNCKTVGIESQIVKVDDKINMVDFLSVLQQLNEDENINGILIFRPLPKQLKEDEICKFINPLKDVDCMSPVNTEKVFIGDKEGFAPCTPEAVIEILKYYKYDLAGKNVAIVNRSMVLGRPLAMLFIGENSTVTICHSKTKDLGEILSRADIVVTGIGRGKFFNEKYFTNKVTVIDVGINFEGGNMCGDVDYDKVENFVDSITPVPGGVGIVTSMILLKHVIKGINLQLKI